MELARNLILVIEDEEDVKELVTYNLARNGYDVISAENGEIGLELARSKLPDLVVLDLMLPGMDGLEICRKLKADPKTKGVFVVMLTAKGEESDIVAGLELGADDYITKPFSPRILLARVRAVLRRQETRDDDHEVFRIHDMVIDSYKRKVFVRDEPVELTATEFQILKVLALRPGWVFTRSQIVDAVHGEDYPVTDRSVDVQIVGLRKKLGTAGGYIETVRGVGYRFKE